MEGYCSRGLGLTPLSRNVGGHQLKICKPEAKNRQLEEIRCGREANDFVSVVRRLGADESKARFEAKLGKIANATPSKDGAVSGTRTTPAAVAAVLLAACTTSTPGPTYDGPVGDPGFPKPEWMLADYCAQGTNFDYCQGYTIDEERQLMVIYQTVLGNMVEDECDKTWLDMAAMRRQSKEWWPDETDPPWSMSVDYELVDRAQHAATQRFRKVRSQTSQAEFCRLMWEEPELKGVLLSTR
jgi:hypothetical protein